MSFIPREGSQMSVNSWRTRPPRPKKPRVSFVDVRKRRGRLIKHVCARARVFWCVNRVHLVFDELTNRVRNVSKLTCVYKYIYRRLCPPFPAPQAHITINSIALLAHDAVLSRRNWLGVNGARFVATARFRTINYD